MINLRTSLVETKDSRLDAKSALAIVTKADRRFLNRHGSGVVWLTGLSGSGKSTIGNLLETRLFEIGVRSYLLDGDNLRRCLNKDLGFSFSDRVENIRRVAEVARLMVDAGLVVIVALISPFRAERKMARELFEHCEFVETFVCTPLSVAENRDVKGLYKKARLGLIPDFTGIDSPYEDPDKPEVFIDTLTVSPIDAVELIFKELQHLRFF